MDSMKIIYTYSFSHDSQMHNTKRVSILLLELIRRYFQPGFTICNCIYYLIYYHLTDCEQARQTRPNSGGLQRAIQDSTKGGLQ